MARTMLIDANLRDFFWPFAVLAATHIKQRVPHSSLPTGTTPFELWFHCRPNLSHLRPFGSKCTTRVITNHLTKFQPRGETGLFLGYAKDAKGYLIWVPHTDNNGGTVKVRRDVIFHDFTPTSPSPDIPDHYLPLWEDITFPDQLKPHPQPVSVIPGRSSSYTNDPVTLTPGHFPSYTNDPVIITPVRSSSHPNKPLNILPPGDPSSHSDNSPYNPRCTTPHPLSTRPQRSTHLPSKYSNFIPSSEIVDQLLAINHDELSIPLPDGPTSATKVISHILDADLILKTAFSVNVDHERDPPTIRHAQRSKYWNEWLAAMHEELEALKAKGVYEEITELPPERKPIQCKWVLQIKRDQNGQISRFKGHLVAKGFTQIFGQDFTFTFAPVARWESIRSVLCIATLHDFELCHIDVKNAYLNAPLQEEIYMVAPDGSGSKYWQLHKGLYGLRQAGRQWYLHLHEAYCSLGYTRCKSDWSVYVRRSPTSLTISATSVDDLLIASNSKTESELAATQIKQKFAVTDGGDIEWLLGCRIRRWRDRRLLMIDQEQYTICILSDFGMENCNAVKTPCPPYCLTTSMCPTSNEERQSAAKLPYCAIVGKVMYLSNCTCPDISFAVRELAKFMSNYGTKHYKAAKHLLRYLQGTRSRGIIYGHTPNPLPIFKCFADSDWGMSEG